MSHATSETTSPLGRLHPEQYAALRGMRNEALRRDPELIELCYARVREIIGAETEGRLVLDGLDERQRAFLDFSEQFATSVAAVSDADVERLLEHAEPVEVYQFIADLYSLEMSTRIELASASLLAEKGASR